ncbi:hypothetical protein FH972_005623 [Carpinus fangiana]|uniref:Autophagy-related protein n=1 Tax=Carpinus fangiana TaxID=176857 RepID=A0A5N6QTB1_9ROSI|nr:hypothetical protein FH972_005623 [Carpinus fangiana]
MSGKQAKGGKEDYFVLKLLIFHISERRLAEPARISEKYPDRIPVIVEKAESSDIPDIDKKKLVASALLLYFKMHYYIVLMI